MIRRLVGRTPGGSLFLAYDIRRLAWHRGFESHRITFKIKRIVKFIEKCSTTIYQLAKELNIKESILYRIKNGKIWKGV